MTEPRTMSQPDSVKTFNEWMRRFIEEPEKHRTEFQIVQDFMTDEQAGREPSYGDTCTTYMFKLLDEMNAAPVAG